MASKGTPDASAADGFHINVHFVGVEEPVLVVVDGKESGPYRWNPASQIDFVTIDLDPALRDLSKVSARILLPCGWQDSKLRERHRYPSGSVAVEISPGFEKRPILVDNRGGAGEEFSIGEWRRPVSANAVASFRVPVPGCTTAEIKFGSRSLGIFRASPGKDVRETYLVDPTGRRCYEYSIAHYRRPDVEAPEPEIGDPPERFGRRVLHRIPGMPDYVFEKAPKTIKEWVGLKSTNKSQLVEVGC